VTTDQVRGCDVEPIHIPGAIQPHGVLLALDPRSLTILQISANCADYFGKEPQELLGRSLSTLMGTAAGATASAAPASSATTGESIVIDIEGRSFDVLTHRHQGSQIVEFERHDPNAPSPDPALRAVLRRLQRPNSVGELCAIAVDAVRKLTGFDRVMMYRFDDDGHGDVIEESTGGDDVASYRGLRFPASDIPRQAREMYLLNWLRLIPDAAYTPVPLVPQLRPDALGPLDLSFATLRSVSPIHLEYLRNMDVRASMSVSLVEANKLWGLIACHHRTPRHISFAARAACEVIGRIMALQIAAQEELSVRASRDALRGTESRLVDAMRERHADVATALAQRGDALLQLAGATGAAVCTATEVRTIGATPTGVQIAALVLWLRQQGAAKLLQTHALAALHPPAAEYAQVASGLLAMSLPHVIPSYVLWFRPEIIRTVTWAGDPAKPVKESGTSAQLHPRHSFEAWTQVVRGSSRPWSAAEIDAVEDLRRRAIEADLGNQINRAEQAVLLRDELIAVVSHDLKNPLEVIAMAVPILLRHVAQDQRAVTTVARVQRGVDRMKALIHDLLDLAKIESGRFDVTLVPCPMNQLVTDALSLIAPLAESKGLDLSWTSDGDPWVNADPERVFQVLGNLVGNAIKFTPEGGTVSIRIDHVGDVVRVAVRDTGPGIPAVELAHIFDRYWQARRGRSAGSGLGLYIAKGIVEAHGQRLWVESTHGEGATFYFTLPAHAAVPSREWLQGDGPRPGPVAPLPPSALS
jgi:chemotaxis family two-component system sensor kinase Cph1